jgi:hypothetical protein
VVAERLMAQLAPKVRAARGSRLACQGFVSSDSLIFYPSQLGVLSACRRSLLDLPPEGTASLGILPVSGRSLFVLAAFSSARYRALMPKDAFTLSDVREPTLTIVCRAGAAGDTTSKGSWRSTETRRRVSG